MFRCIPMPSATAIRFRAEGVDDGGNRLRRMVADGPGFPCRHCLQLGQPGEAMLLGSFHLPRPAGIYWTPSPVFLHAEACPAFDAPDTIAPTVLANGLVSVRAYDAGEQCLYELGQVCAGIDVAAPLHRALVDARTVFVNVHTARPGCWLTRVELVG